MPPNRLSLEGPTFFQILFLFLCEWSSFLSYIRNFFFHSFIRNQTRHVKEGKLVLRVFYFIPAYAVNYYQIVMYVYTVCSF